MDVASPAYSITGRTMTPIQEFYHGKNVFITGASGFMGKILLEKLLRACPTVGNVYLLLRTKKGEAPAERIETLLHGPVFERIRRERGPGFMSQGIIAISGDIMRPGLGLSPDDRATLSSSVHVVFHVAATVRFDEKLKTALQTNLGGTRSVLQLCRDMPQLKALVYVSTAYSNSPRKQIDEVIYTPPVDPDEILTCMDWMSDEQFEVLAPSLLGAWPNTYAYSKMLAETLVTKHCDSIPISIFRPAIVTSTHREPVAGWVDNMNGPSGITAGASVGIIRCFRCDSNLTVDLVPVDMAANAMLAAAWATGSAPPTEAKVYNFVSSAQRPIKWHEYVRYCEDYGLQNPSQQAIWYYMLVMTKRKGLFNFLSLFLHDLPARAMDFFSAMLGKSQKMTKMYAKIDKFNDLMSYFTTRQWEFNDMNVRTLNNILTPEDRAIFPFDISELRWEPYIRNYMAGIRLHLLNEKPDNLVAARRKFFALYLLHRGVQLGLAYGVVRFFFTLATFVRRGRKLM